MVTVGPLMLDWDRQGYSGTVNVTLGLSKLQ